MTKARTLADNFAADINGITAGTGITGGGTSGTVTVTNEMATIIDAKGDLVGGTGADTFARLAVGANDTVLTADSDEATGMKWATASAGGMTLLATTTLTGGSVTLSSIPQTYKNLQVVVNNFLPSTTATLEMRINGDSNANRYGQPAVFFVSDNTYTDSSMQMIRYPGSTHTTSICVIDIPNYTDATTLKMVNRMSVCQNPSTAANYNSIQGQYLYNQTSAITSLVFFPGSGTFTSGTVLLYGVK
jgi:hypothetical protein